MSSFDHILRDLKKLQAELRSTNDRLWWIKSALQRAEHAGHESHDFLPRRLNQMQMEAEWRLENALAELGVLAAESLEPRVFVFNSPEEVQTFLAIKQTLRSLQNAYMDYGLRAKLSHLNAILS